MTKTLFSDRSSTVASSSAQRLRSVLLANATTSALSGLFMAVAPGQLDALLGTGRPGWVRVVGMALLPFAVVVAWLSTRGADRSLRLLVPGVIAGDAGWVIVSALTVVFGWYSVTGVFLVLVMAAVVDAFAVMQWRSLRRLSR